MEKIYNDILDVSNNYYNYLMSLKNVIGIGLGNKYINNFNTFEPCIHVLVKEKIDKKYLSLNNIIPKVYMGIKTDVIKTGKFKCLESNISAFQKFRPLEGGCGITYYGSDSFGTLGCIVSRMGIYNNEYFLLSNNHVIAGLNAASLGTPIIQPISKDIFKPSQNIIAYLDKYIPIKLNEGGKEYSNYVDCAIAKIIRKNLISDKVFSVGKIEGSFKPRLEENIKKVGVITGLTTGKIITIGANDKVEFSKNRIGIFKNQIIAKMNSASGDSGSIILNEDNEVIGLLMSGSDDEDTVTFNDINLVLQKLGVEIYTK